MLDSHPGLQQARAYVYVLYVCMYIFFPRLPEMSVRVPAQGTRCNRLATFGRGPGLWSTTWAGEGVTQGGGTLMAPAGCEVLDSSCCGAAYR